MFLGEYQHTLDPKGRVSLPARFRVELGEKIVISRGFEGCLYIHPASDYREFLSDVLDGSDFDPKVAKVRRFFATRAFESEVDKSGRVHLLPAYREYAGLEGKVVVAGNVDRIELWDTERWAEVCEEIDAQAQGLAAEIAYENRHPGASGAGEPAARGR